MLLVVLCGHQCTSAIKRSVWLHLRWGLSVVCLWSVVCSVVCLCLLFCSAWMCCLEDVYMDICCCDMFSVVNVYLGHLKFCVVCINDRRYVCCGECYVVSDLKWCSTIGWWVWWAHILPCATYRCVLLSSYILWVFDFRGELCFLNCDDICICVVNKQFELLEFVFESVYVDLQSDEISYTFTAGYVCLCGVCSLVAVLGLFVRLSWYPMLWVRKLRWLWCMYCCLSCICVCCDNVRVRGWRQCWCGGQGKVGYVSVF